MFSKLALASAFLAALPSVHTAPAMEKRQDMPSSFYLVTTTSYAPALNGNVSALPNVSVISLFDPYYQQDYFLRLTGPGYGSAPVFTHGDYLQTVASGPHGIPASQTYTAFNAGEDKELTLYPQEEGSTGGAGGDLNFQGGYLLSTGNFANGWTICDGDFGQQVIKYRGTDESCSQVYIHAVETLPY